MKAKHFYLKTVIYLFFFFLTDVTVFAQIPQSPSNFMAIPVSNSEINLSWMDGLDEINYVLDRSDGDSLNYTQIAVIDMDSVSYSDTGLLGGTEYYYRIKAVGMIDDSGYSYSFIMTAPDPTPSIPSNFMTTSLSATQLDLSWGDSDIETSYVIERSLSEFSGYSQIATPASDATSYSDTNLSSQTTYYYKIKAVGANGDSDYALTSETTQAHPVPSTPTMFMASAASFSQIDLTWSDVANEEGYTIQRSTTSGSGYTTIVNLSTDDTTYSDTGLSGNTTYFYQVKANGIDQDSPYSDEIFEITPSAVPDVPANFQALAESATQIDLSWVDVMNETEYTIEGSDDGGSNYDPLTTLSADVTSYSVTDLNDQTTYHFRLKATNTNGSSAFAFANETTPTYPIPPKPTNLAFSSLQNNTMTLNWDDGPDEEGYTLERKLLSDTVFTLIANLNEDDNDHNDSGLSSGTTYVYRVKANGINQDSDYSDELTVTTAPDAPSSFNASVTYNDPQTLEIHLSWNDVTGENSYAIERSLDNDNNYQVYHSPSANETSFVDITVSNNTVYYYRLKAIGPDGVSSTVTDNLTTPPATPTNLELIAVNTNRVDLNWDYADGETSYRIQRSTTSGNGFSTINNPSANDTSYTDNSVSGNTTYYYQIQSRNTSNGNSPYSAEVSILTQPDTPANLTASVISNAQIDLSWDSVGSEVTYTLEKSNTSGSGFIALTTIPSLSYSDIQIVGNTTYYYRIKAQNESGASAYSSEISVTSAPVTPTNLTGSTVNESQINISWDDVSDETAYTVQRSIQQGTGFSDIGTNSANDTTFSDSNLSANTTYYYRVRSGNSNGNSLYSGEIEVTTAPAPPTNLSATATSDSNLQLSWDPSTGATNYTIERSTTSGSGFSQIAIENAGIYNDGSLNANTTYYYRLKASNTNGSSSYSSEFSGLTLLQKPTGLMADSNYGNELEMEWNGVNGATAYQLERKDDANPSFSIVATVNGQTSTWVTDSGLQYGTAYTYRLKALSSGNVNDSEYSDEVTIVTHPAKPTNVSAIVFSATQIDLSWDDVTGETEYLIQRSLSSGSGYSTIDTISANSIGYSNTNLEDNTTYFYQILARNTGGNSDPSDEVNGLTLLHTPTDLEVDSIYGTQVDLVWGEVTHNNGFIIERKDDANPTFTQVGTNPINDRYFTDSGLNYGTDYTYRIKAIGPNGNDSHYSAELDVLTIPITPQNFVGTHSEIQTEASNPWEVNLSWGDGLGETGYTVERKIEGEGSFSVISNSGAGTTSLGDDNSGDGFEFNALIDYRIKASNGSGSSPYANLILRMRTATPTGLSLNVVSYDQIDLSWNDVTGDTAYIVERSTTSGSGFTQIGTTSANDTDYSDNSVQSNTTYYYRIISVNAGGNSQHSSEKSATTPIETPVFSVSVVSSSQLDLNWADVTGEDNYIIERSSTSGSGFSVIDTVGSNTTSYADTGLDFNTTYYYQIKAVNSGNSSSYSNEESGLTLLETPYELDLAGSSTVTGIELYLSWQGNENVEVHYIIERKLASETDYTAIDTIVRTDNSNQEIQYDDITIDYATTYNYKVKGTIPSTGNYSEYSNIYTVRSAPADVSNFTVTAQYFGNGDGTYRMQSVSNWDDVNGEYQYELTKGTNSNKFLSQELITKLDSNTTTYTEDSLAFNEMYWYRIRALGDQSLSYDVGNSNPVYVQFFTPTEVPSGLSASTTSSSSIDLSWTDVDGDTAYVLERSLSSGTGFSVIATLGEDVTSYTDNNASSNTTYFYRVKSMSLGGASIYSDEASATTLTENVQNLSGTPEIVDNGDGTFDLQIHLKWDDLSDDNGYKIHSTTVGPYSELNTNAQDDTTYTDSNLFYNVYYYYKVRGINSEGSVASLNNTDVLIVQTPTDVPTGLTANVTSPTSIDLSWTDIDGDTAYVIERSLTSGSGFSLAGTNSSDDVTFSDTGLTPGTIYYYRVKAQNGGGDSRYSDEIIAITPPETPTGLIAIGVSSSRIDLIWDDIDGETNYIIEMALSVGGTFNPIASISANDTTQADLGLDAGTQYFYRIKATSNGIDSDYSQEVFAFTLVDTPTNFSGQAVSTIQIDLSWDDVDGELGYMLERADSLGGDFLPVGVIMTDSTSYSDAGLQFSHTYYYRLASNGPAGDSPYTDTLTITTLAPIPDVPMNFMANAISNSEIVLGWDDGLDESGYTLERSLTQGSGYSVIANLSADSTMYSDTGLNVNTSYYYRLKANGTQGDSDYTLADATTDNYTVPPVPAGFMVMADSSNNVVINWIDGPEETSYSIERSVNNDSTFLVLTNPSSNDTTYTDNCGSEGTVNYYRMKAVNNTVSSAYTNMEMATIPLNAPTSLSASVISSTQIDLSWADNSSAESGFVLQRSDIDDQFIGATEIQISQNATFYSDNSVTGGTTYYYRLKAVNANLSSDFSNVVNGTTDCNVPSNVTVSNISDNQVDISLTGISGATNYQIQYRIAGVPISSVFVDTDSANSTIMGLSAGTNYEIRVRSFCAASGVFSNYSSFQSFTTTGSVACDIPSGISISNILDNSIDISWGAVTGAESYEIQYRLDGIPASAIIVNNATTNMTIAGLDAGTDYEVRVKTVCTSGMLYSDYSGFQSFTTTGAIACDIPTSVSISNITDNSVDISWGAVTGATSYEIQYRLDGIPASAIIVNNVSTSTTIAGLDAGTDYEIRVKTVCTDGTLYSDYSSFQQFTTTGSIACDIPTSVATSNITDNSVDISWGAVTGATSYEIQYRIAGVPSSAMIVNTVSTSTTIIGLDAGTDYEIRVKTVCTDGTLYSDYSNFQLFTTTGAVACDIPTSVTLSNITDNSVDISWGAVTGATSYEIQYRLDGIPASAIIVNNASTSTTISGLDAGADYEIRVKTVCTDGTLYSDYSGFQSFTTTGAVACAIPSGISISNIMDNSIDFSWGAVTGATSYQIQYRIEGVPSSAVYLNVSGTSTTISGLFSGTDYEIRIQTICTDGILYSDYSGFQLFTTTGSVACAIPSGVATSNVTDNGVDLSWTAVSGATSYQVQYREYGTPSTNVFLTSGTNSISITGLTAGTNYEIRVKTICTAGQLFSDFSQFQSFTTTNSVAKIKLIEDIDESTDIKLSVYPNPSNGEIFIKKQLVEEELIRVLIYNTIGTLIHQSEHLQIIDAKLNLKRYGSGMYIIKVMSEGFVETQKVVIR